MRRGAGAAEQDEQVVAEDGGRQHEREGDEDVERLAPVEIFAREQPRQPDADAAFLPRSLVKQDEGRFVEIDESLHRPIAQAVCVVRATPRPEAARRFVEFLLSEEARAVMRSFGYAAPP